MGDRSPPYKRVKEDTTWEDFVARNNAAADEAARRAAAARIEDNDGEPLAEPPPRQADNNDRMVDEEEEEEQQQQAPFLHYIGEDLPFGFRGYYEDENGALYDPSEVFPTIDSIHPELAPVPMPIVENVGEHFKPLQNYEFTDANKDFTISFANPPLQPAYWELYTLTPLSTFRHKFTDPNDIEQNRIYVFQRQGASFMQFRKSYRYAEIDETSMAVFVPNKLVKVSLHYKIDRNFWKPCMKNLHTLQWIRYDLRKAVSPDVNRILRDLAHRSEHFAGNSKITFFMGGNMEPYYHYFQDLNTLYTKVGANPRLIQANYRIITIVPNPPVGTIYPTKEDIVVIAVFKELGKKFGISQIINYYRQSLKWTKELIHIFVKPHYPKTVVSPMSYITTHIYDVYEGYHTTRELLNDVTEGFLIDYRTAAAPYLDVEYILDNIIKKYTTLEIEYQPPNDEYEQNCYL